MQNSRLRLLVLHVAREFRAQRRVLLGFGLLIGVHAVTLAAVVGGMLGVGLFAYLDPKALTMGGMFGAATLAVLFTFIYRWGIKGLI